MKYTWLNKTDTDKIIIFFNGWGMDSKVVSHLDCQDYNVITFYDYNDLEGFDKKEFERYSQKHLISWSMGVMTATLFDFGKLNSAVAICGTPKAIDDKYGIPERIYNLTIRGFSEDSSKKFMERMFLNPPERDFFPDRTFENKLSELKKLLTYKANPDFCYTKAIVADSDKIFPTKNQTNYWKNPTVIHCGHCPFMLYSNWTELL